MAEWWEVGDTQYDLYGGGGGGSTAQDWYDPSWFSVAPDMSWDFDIGDWEFDFPDFNVPDINFGPIQDWSFDPGLLDLGFDPSFDIGQYAGQISDPFLTPQGNLDLPSLNIGLNGSPFDLWGNTAGATPGLEYQPSVMAELTPNSFGENFPAFEPADLGLSSMLGSNVGGGFDPNMAFSEAEGFYGPRDLGEFGRGPGPSRYEDALSEEFGPGYYNQYQGGERPPPFDVKAPKTQAELDAELRRGAVEAQMFSNKWSPWAMGGQAAAPLLGGLLQAFGPGPKRPEPTDLERRKVEAEISAIEAKIALEKEALRLKAEAMGEGGGGGGGMEAPEDPRLAIAEIQAQVAREQMAMEAETAEKLRRRPLMQLDPRFSTLYDETTAAQQGLSPESPDIQSMTQQIYSVRMQGLQQEYGRQRDAIIERANRLGHNPAAEMAQINEAEQKAMSAVMVEAQQAALAFAQERLQPSTALLDAILKTVV